MLYPAETLQAVYNVRPTLEIMRSFPLAGVISWWSAVGGPQLEQDWEEQPKQYYNLCLVGALFDQAGNRASVTSKLDHSWANVCRCI